MKSLITVLLIVISSINVYSQWEHCTEDLNGGYIKTMVVFNDRLFVGKDTSGIYYSSNNGESWSNVYSKGNTGIYTFTSSGNFIFAGTDNSQILVSTDLGITWSSKTFTIFDTWIYLTNCGNNLIAGTMSGVFSSSDFGDTWKAMNNGLSNIAINSIFSIGNNVYAGTNKGIYLSTDCGESWRAKNSDLSQPTLSIKAKDENIYASTYTGMYYSSDNGDTWSFKKIDTSYKYTYSLDLIGNYIIAGTNKGAFITSNNGDNWISINNGLTNSFVKALSHGNKYLYAGTNNGIFEVELSKFGMTGIEHEIKVFEEVYISPNPVSDYFTINTNQGIGKIEIFSTLGLKVLESEWKEKIDVSSLVAGVYFIRIGDIVEKFVKY